MLALLAVLISYNFDFECLLESSERCLQDQSVSTCIEPNLMPLPIALLPTHTPVRAPSPTLIVRLGKQWVPSELPVQASLSVPLGLRAPPTA